MVTSSAVVGSSAISSLGLQAIAMAIITRWLMPPESWCGKAPSRSCGDGMPTRSRSSRARLRAALRSMPSWKRSASVSWNPTVKQGFKELIGSWKIIAMSLPISRRRWRALDLQQRLALEGQPVGGDLGGPGQEAHHRQHGHALARPALADDAHDLAGLDGEVDPVHGAERT